MNKEETIYFTYEVKCRKCNKIEKMFFSDSSITTKETFETYVKHHSNYPIDKQCKCDNGSIMFHDLISFKIIL